MWGTCFFLFGQRVIIEPLNTRHFADHWGYEYKREINDSASYSSQVYEEGRQLSYASVKSLNDGRNT